MEGTLGSNFDAQHLSSMENQSNALKWIIIPVESFYHLINIWYI